MRKKWLTILCQFMAIYMVLIFFTGNIFADQQAIRVKNQKAAITKKTDKIKEKPVKLETMTITAEKFAAPEKSSPRFITIITSEELMKTGANNLLDALNRMGGFVYKSYGPLGLNVWGNTSSLAIRGIAGGELVLINGSPIQGSGGKGYNIHMISPAMIERVEILKGAAASLYGADAMTGVINIITKENKKEPVITASAIVGTKDMHNYLLNYAGNMVNFGINYTHLGEQKGRISKTNRSITGTVYQKAYKFNFSFNPVGKLKFDYLGAFQNAQFKTYNYKFKTYKVKDQDHYTHFVNLGFENDFFKIRAFNSHESLTVKRNIYSSTSTQDTRKNYNSGLEADYKFVFENMNITLGADYTNRVADYSYGRHQRNDYAAFFQAKYSFFDKVFLVTGARQQFINGESNGEDYTKFLPELGVNVSATDNLSFFANTGKAFRAPSFSYLYMSIGTILVGNPDLNPEEGWTHELGFKYDNDLCSVRMAGFWMNYKDKISLDRSSKPYKWYNAGDYESKGIEWNINLFPFFERSDFLNNLSMNVAGYYADPEGDGPRGKKKQIGTKFQTSAGVSFDSSKFFININCNILANRPGENDKNVATINFLTRVKLHKGFLIFSGDNIFNQNLSSSDIGDQRFFKIGYEVTF